MKRHRDRQRGPSRGSSDGPARAPGFYELLTPSSSISATAAPRARKESGRTARALWQARARFKQDFESARDALLELLAEYPATQLLTSIQLDGLVGDKEAEKPEESVVRLQPFLRDAAAEYLLNLASSVRIPPEARELTHEVDSRCRSLLLQALQATELYFLAEADSPTPPPEYAKRQLWIVLRLFHRGPSHPTHHTDLIRALFEPFGDRLRDALGFTAADLVEAVANIREQLTQQLHQFLDTTKKLRALHADFVVWCEGADHATLPIDEQLQRFHSQPHIAARLKVLDKRMADGGATQLVEIEANGIVTPQILDRISLTPGADRSFLLPPANGSPIARGPATHRPVFRSEGRFLLPAPAVLHRNLQGILEAGLLTADGRLPESVAATRHDVVVRLVESYLCSLLPGARAWRHSRYQPDPTDTGRRREIDLLISGLGVALICEVKAGHVSEAALRGAPAAIDSTIDELLTYPTKQLAEAEAYLFERAEAELLDARGALSTVFRSADHHHHFKLLVTLSDLSHLTAQLAAVREHVTDASTAQLPIGFFINDLRIVSEILSGQSQFLLYLRRRAELGQHPGVRALDESQLLGFFLERGLFFTPEELEDVAAYYPQGFHEALDNYYRAQVTGDKVVKPALATHPRIAEIVGSLDAGATTEGTIIGSELLGLAMTAQLELVRDLDRMWLQLSIDDRPHGHVIRVDGLAGPLAIAVLPPGNTVDWRAVYDRRHELRAVIGRSADRHALYLHRGADNRLTATAAIFRRPNNPHPDLLKAALVFRIGEYSAYCKTHGRPPGVNETCPCGSGEKFKRCCLPVRDGREQTARAL